MLEVRSSYLVKAKDIKSTIELWKEARVNIWPALSWQGRIQQMLHGHAQQTLFVWSAEWESMAAWEAGMARTLDNKPYQDWAKEMNKLRVYGEEREVFTILEPSTPGDTTPGKVEVRSSYLVQMQNVTRVKDLMCQAQEKVWPALNWSGQNQQMLHGKAAQSMFLWSSTWDNLATWEQAMGKTVGHDIFQAWYKDFLEAVDFGGPREIFKNL